MRLPSRFHIPQVSVSNPHSLGLQAVICEDGYTYDGNTKHRLNISLKQQHHWGRADPNFTSRYVTTWMAVAGGPRVSEGFP